MSKEITTSFTKVKLTEQDIRQGCSLPSLAVAVIQNLRSDIAEEKLNLPFTPNDVLSYTQKEAYLKGQLEILTYLLQMSEDSQSTHHI